MMSDPSGKDGYAEALGTIWTIAEIEPTIFGEILAGLATVVIAVVAADELSDTYNYSEDHRVIYRSGNLTNKNCTPRLKDIDGVSFWLTPQGDKNIATTISAVNATGLLHCKVNEVTGHVGVYATIPEAMESWQLSRDNPNIEQEPHPYSVLLKSICWKMGRSSGR